MHHKVVHLTSVHGPFDVRIMRECRTLAAHGYDVSLVVPTDCDAVADGVKIVHVPKPRHRSQRMTQTASEICRQAFAQDGDVYHIHDPELLPVGMLLASHGRKHVIYDAHEDVCKSILDRDWIPRRMRKTVSFTTRHVLRVSTRCFSGVVAAWPNIFTQIKHVRKALVQNYPIPEEYCTDAAPSLATRSNVAVCVGGLCKSRCINEMVEAIGLPVIPDDAVLRLGGIFDEDDAASEATVASGIATGRVEYCGWVDKVRYRELLATAKVGLSVLHPTPAYQETPSTKIFEYMSAGIPVVVSNFPRTREIVDECDCGIAVDPMNPQEIAAAVSFLMRNPKQAQAMGMRGLEAVRRRYNWHAEAEQLLKLYDRVLHESVAIA